MGVNDMQALASPGSPAADAAAAGMAIHDRAIGEIIREVRPLTDTQIQQILSYQREHGLRFGEAAIALRIVNNVSRADIDCLLPKAAGSMGRLADADAVMRVAAANADSIWLVFRGAETTPGVVLHGTVSGVTSPLRIRIFFVGTERI